MTRTEKGSSSSTTLYLYGYGLIASECEGSYLYHHYNHLGSTMKLTDESGQVVACYTYGTYGELLSGDTTFTPFLYNGRCGVTTDDNGLYYMRQRYYNSEIKRFVNQDILTGSLNNSQSLNRYSYVQGNPVSYTDPFGLAPENEMSVGSMIAHGVLGIVGMVPGWVGVVANLADAAIYAFVDHDYGMMAVSLVNAFSMGAAKFLTGTGRVVTKATRWGIFGRTITDATSKTAKYAYVFSEIVSNGMTFGMAVNDTMELGFYMYEKYEIHGRSYNADTIYEGAAMIMNIFTMGMSGAETVFQCKALAGLIEAENIGGRLKAAFLNQTSSQRNQRLDGGSESGSSSSGLIDGAPEPEVQNFIERFKERYPGREYKSGHKLQHSDGRNNIEIDFETDNAILEFKRGKGKGLTSQIIDRQDPMLNPNGKVVIGVPGSKMSRFAQQDVENAGGLMSNDIDLLLELIKPD